MIQNSLTFAFVLLLVVIMVYVAPSRAVGAHGPVKIKTIAEPLGGEWYRHYFTHGDIEVEDEQVGVGTGYVYYMTPTDRYFNFSYPGPNRMRNIITYVEGEFITDTSYVEVLKTDGNLWERFIRFQIYAREFKYFNFQLVAWAI